MHFWRPQGCPWTSEGRLFILTVQKWHTKWFFRGVPNTKVVSISVTNKMTCILVTCMDVHGHSLDTLFLWQPKSSRKNDFPGMSSIQNLLLFVGPTNWYAFWVCTRTSTDINELNIAIFDSKIKNLDSVAKNVKKLLTLEEFKKIPKIAIRLSFEIFPLMDEEHY